MYIDAILKEKIIKALEKEISDTKNSFKYIVYILLISIIFLMFFLDFELSIKIIVSGMLLIFFLLNFKIYQTIGYIKYNKIINDLNQGNFEVYKTICIRIIKRNKINTKSTGRRGYVHYAVYEINNKKNLRKIEDGYNFEIQKGDEILILKNINNKKI